MTEEIKKDVVQSNLTIGVYTIYDCVLKQFDLPFAIADSKLADYLHIIANDVQSKYYNHESDYIVNKIGSFDSATGEIELRFVERVCILDTYVSEKTRTIQSMMQTLNYLPSGYFKMPDEMKKNIQDDINKAVQDYVQNYVIPDLDVVAEKKKISDISS